MAVLFKKLKFTELKCAALLLWNGKAEEAGQPHEGLLLPPGKKKPTKPVMSHIMPPSNYADKYSTYLKRNKNKGHDSNRESESIPLQPEQN